MKKQLHTNEFEKGRGAQINPANSFLKNRYVQEEAFAIDDYSIDSTQTQYFYENSKTIANKVINPDVGMEYSANPYQGCEHGCIYCYARNSHEYWGYSAGKDFESKIIVKKNAPALLKKLFESKTWVPSVLSISGNTDCYQPVERRMKLTRAMLEVCLEYRNPVGLLTKNALVLRDLDILTEMAKLNLVRVHTSITSLDEDLRLQLEPRTTTYKSRLNILEQCSKAGIPTGIMNAPIIPGLNDHHMPDVIKAAADHGAKWAGYTVVRLNGAIGEIFKNWLDFTFPDRAQKVWNMIADCHGGQVSDSRIGNRISGEGKFAELIKNQFELLCRKYGLNQEGKHLNKSLFRRSPGCQMTLFS